MIFVLKSRKLIKVGRVGGYDFKIVIILKEKRREERKFERDRKFTIELNGSG